MKPLTALLLSFLFTILFAVDSNAQAPKMLTRTTTKTDRLDFGAGGTLVVAGAPKGSITVEAGTTGRWRSPRRS